MTACVIRQFCCGCKLRHGAITAAVIQAITVVVFIGAGAYYLYLAESIPQKIYDYQRGLTTSVPNLNYEHSSIDLTQNFELFSLKVRAIVLILEGIGGAIILGCLIGGIVKEIPGLIVPWLVITILHIIGYCLNALAQIVNQDFLIFGSLLVAVFYIYLWIVVLNYFHELRMKRKAGIPSLVNQEWEPFPPPPPPYSEDMMKI